MEIEPHAIRSLMRTAKTPFVRVIGDSSHFSSPRADDRRVQTVLTNGPERVSRISATTDLILWALGEVEQRLKDSGYGRTTLSVPPKLYGLLCGALADGLLFNSSGMDMAVCLLAHMRKLSSRELGPGSGALIKELTGYALSGDSRSIVITLAPPMFSMDGNDLAEKLNIPLCRRPPRITPAWTAQFQSSTRPSQFWFEDIPGGVNLFVICHALRCSYDQCFGCALPDLSATHPISATDTFEQMDYLFNDALISFEKEEVSQLTLSNNGSIFDEETFPRSALLYALKRAGQHFPRLKSVVLETRAEFVNDDALNLVTKCLSEMDREICFELAVGVEIFDQRLRNKVQRKGLSNRRLHALARTLGGTGGALRCYFMLKPLPVMSDDEAYADIERGLDFLEKIAVDNDVPVTMHLNPTYAAIGTELEQAFREGTFVPPKLGDLVEFLSKQPSRAVKVHIGLNDEGLATDGGSFLQEGSEADVELLRRFNRTGDVSSLVS